MLSYLKLPFQFDADRLKADLNAIPPDAWIAHFNKFDYQGQWSGVALRSVGGTPNIVPHALSSNAPFVDTPLLAQCHYIREILTTFECPQQSVRFLKLHAGSSIREHVDHALDYEDGEIRLHIPVVTNPDVKFYLDGERLIMQEGECWYTNVNLPHRVDNHSAQDRTHLVIDCKVNDWIRSTFETTSHNAPPGDAARRYRAVVWFPETLEFGEIINLFTRCAETLSKADCPVRLIGYGNGLLLSWQARPSQWQLRVNITAADSQTDQDATWAALPQAYAHPGTHYNRRLTFESSPDPDLAHRDDYQFILEHIKHTSPSSIVLDEYENKVM